jgi:hypothetical protein
MSLALARLGALRGLSTPAIGQLHVSLNQPSGTTWVHSHSDSDNAPYFATEEDFDRLLLIAVVYAMLEYQETSTESTMYSKKADHRPGKSNCTNSRTPLMRLIRVHRLVNLFHPADLFRRDSHVQ